MATTEYRLDSSAGAPTDDAGAPLETMAAWCEHHGLLPALLPFECRRTDTFAEFRTLAAALRDLPETAATFRLGDLETPEGSRPVMHRTTSSGVVETQLHLLGAWQYRVTSCGQRWINPHYIHNHPWQSAQCDTGERVAIATRAANLGAITTAMLAPRFGITTQSLRRFFCRQDFEWSDRRRGGLRRLARTLRTVYAWGDYSERELAEPFAQPDGTIRGWIHTYARDADWEPPADPSQYHGFQTGTGGGAGGE